MVFLQLTHPAGQTPHQQEQQPHRQQLLQQQHWLQVVELMLPRPFGRLLLLLLSALTGSSPLHCWAGGPTLLLP
jgi:hypothetical protein